MVGLKKFALLLALSLLIPMQASAIVVEGMGKTPDQAIKNALQQAVETALGTVVHGRSLVDSGQLIRDDILTHARGYVSAFKILRKVRDKDGHFFVELDANVNVGRIHSHTQSMEILMKMSGQPKVLIFGISDDVESIPTVTANYPKLIQAVKSTFQDRFRFSVLDLETIRARHPEFTGELDRRKAQKWGRKVGADFLVMVKVNATRRGSGVQGGLIMEAVRASDAHFLGKEMAPFQLWNDTTNPQRFTQEMVARAGEDVFGLSIQLAHRMVLDMQGEVDGSTGFRYTLTFTNFPPGSVESLFRGQLNDLTGYVRHELNQQRPGFVKMAYWSHLKGDELQDAISDVLKHRRIKFQKTLDGRLLQFIWNHPIYE